MSKSPLEWLRQRKDSCGKSLIDDCQFDAGERLQEDYCKGQMSARVTTNWSAAGMGGSHGRGYRDPELDMHDSALAARERVRRAFKDVGPELSGILFDVCCNMRGLAQAERTAGIPTRSGKVVLGLALTALARHYKLVGVDARAADRRAASTRHWGAQDYRPEITRPDEPAT